MPVAALIIPSVCFSQSPLIEWQTRVSGNHMDQMYSVARTTDSCYVFGAESLSPGPEVPDNYGYWDFLVFKINDAGQLLWSRNLGGSREDRACKVVEGKDGFLYVAGYSDSDDHDVTGNLGDTDVLVIKLDQDGNTIWVKNYGGTGYDKTETILPTADGNLIIAGECDTYAGDSAYLMGPNVYILKIDTAGNEIWSKKLGGFSHDSANEFDYTSDGGYIIGGHTESDNGDVFDHRDGVDVWFIKLDSIGDTLWTRSYCGNWTDNVYDVTGTFDGGFIACGLTYSREVDFAGNTSYSTYWVTRFDRYGYPIWTSWGCYVPMGRVRSIIELPDNSFLTIGFGLYENSWGFSKDVVINEISMYGGRKTFAAFGGSEWDSGSDIIANDDGSLVVAAYSKSSDGDVAFTMDNNNGDLWLFKLSEYQDIPEPEKKDNIRVYPNPAGNFVNVDIKDKAFNPFYVRVYDLTGRKLIEKLHVSGNSIMINVENLQQGVYFIEVHGDII
ncbi:MAG: hypothetical protein C0594_16460, partial [Marinilabiliales bacterium]